MLFDAGSSHVGKLRFGANGKPFRRARKQGATWPERASGCLRWSGRRARVWVNSPLSWREIVRRKRAVGFMLRFGCLLDPSSLQRDDPRSGLKRLSLVSLPLHAHSLAVGAHTTAKGQPQASRLLAFP